jgi:hypothetical protein
VRPKPRPDKIALQLGLVLDLLDLLAQLSGLLLLLSMVLTEFGEPFF